jgi:uncharacterized membrane protein HdeD (DUF308 family)
MNELSQAMRESSRTGTVLGIATIIFGVLAIFMPMFAGLMATTIVGVLLIAGGIARTIYAFKEESFGKGVLVFLLGGLYIAGGVILMARPLLGLAALTLVLAVVFLVDGISEIVAAFKVRGRKGWFWLVIGGIASIVLAYLIWRQWPVSGRWAVGILVGARLIFAGWSMIALGAVGESVVDEVEKVSDEPASEPPTAPPGDTEQ